MEPSLFCWHVHLLQFLGNESIQWLRHGLIIQDLLLDEENEDPPPANWGAKAGPETNQNQNPKQHIAPVSCIQTGTLKLAGHGLIITP